MEPKKDKPKKAADKKKPEAKKAAPVANPKPITIKNVTIAGVQITSKRTETSNLTVGVIKLQFSTRGIAADLLQNLNEAMASGSVQHCTIIKAQTELNMDKKIKPGKNRELDLSKKKKVEIVDHTKDKKKADKVKVTGKAGVGAHA